MHWFSFRKKLTNLANLEIKKLLPLYEGNRGLAELHEVDAELRVWVSEPLKLAMREVSKRLDNTVSRYLRDFFVVYLYGAHELLCMIENKTGVFFSPPPPPSPDSDEAILFSRVRSIEFIPGLGKNIVPLKLILNAKIKTDLQVLADKAGIPLSQFVREILVSHFLGHTVWPERKKLITKEQEALANSWEAGDIVVEFIKSPSPEEEAALLGKIETMIL